MTKSKESRLEREGCMVPSFGDNTAHTYYSCNRYVTANDYSNFQYLVIKFGTPRAKHYCCMCWHCHRKGHLHYKGQSLAKSQKFFNAANDVVAAIAVKQLQVHLCSPSKHHALHAPSISYIHASLFPGYSEVQLIVLRALYSFPVANT